MLNKTAIADDYAELGNATTPMGELAKATSDGSTTDRP